MAELFQFLGIVLVGYLIVLAIDRYRYGSWPDTLTAIDPDDPRLIEAHERARKSLAHFWEKRASAVNPEDFYIKARFEDSNGAEHLWIEAPVKAGNRVTGNVENIPTIVKGVRHYDLVTVELEQVCDWMYHEDEMIHGNYSLRVTGRPPRLKIREYTSILDRLAPLPEIEATNPDES